MHSMSIVSETVAYVLFFITIYFEVFMLITYFEVMSKKNILGQKLSLKLPSVSIIVPCWNEENTITKTILSLLEIDYPRDSLSIVVIDDGSTDNTWGVLQKFSKEKQIKMLRKENGGKHSALNFALGFIESEFVGCLDADSFVHPQALRRIISHFDEGKKIMAVTPSIKIHKPKNVLEMFQKAEYEWGILLRNLLSYLDAMFVTPGPFTIFRRELFDIIGGYRHAHQTEDMEIALRMQTFGYKIGNASDAYVYTVAPKTIKTLYKQRLRWTYGFLKNAIDYKHIFFNPKYGHLGFIVLPTASISIFSSIYVMFDSIVGFLRQIFNKIIEIKTVGINFQIPNFDWFYIDTGTLSFVGIISLILIIIMILFSKKMSEGNHKFGLDMIYFLLLYPILAPLWATRAVYNVVFAQNTKWR